MTQHLRTAVATLRERWAFFALLVVAFSIALAYRGGLHFDVFLDEYWFWRQTLWFVDRWPPGIHELRNYPEPMTPLSFLVWGVVEWSTGAGIAGARLTTLAMGAVLLGLIGLQRSVAPGVALRTCIGLLVFPYTVALSIHVYTDVPAALFTVGGFWLYARRRPGLAGLSFALAIATRQYMVVFPAALVAAELTPLVLPNGLLRTLGAEPASFRWSDPRIARSLPIALGAASLLAWIAFFGGLGPQHGLDDWPRHNVSVAGLEPAYALYFLTCVGAYFVVPETLLFGRVRKMQELLLTPRALFFGLGLALLYVILFPIESDVPMGPLNRAARLLLPSEYLGPFSGAIRLMAYGGLAWLACVRFARFDLVFWMLLASACLMLASFEAWEKYNLAVLASLWYLRSNANLESPIDLWTALGDEETPTRSESGLG